MNRFPRATLAALVSMALVACGDPLTVVNRNNPETSRVLAKPTDVEKLIADSYNAFYVFSHYIGPRIQNSNIAFEHAGNPANFGQIDASQLPRVALLNDLTNSYQSSYSNEYYGMNSALSAANDGLRALNGGTNLGSTALNARASAWAKFVQGLTIGHLAIDYDSVFVVDESTAIEDAGFVASDSAMKVAFAKFQQAIDLATANSFTIPSTWVPGNSWSSTDFVKVIRSYRARYRAAVARTPAERASVDWNAVIADVDNGIASTVSVTHDGLNLWYDYYAYIMSFSGTWNSVAYQFMGMADTTGAFQSWSATPLASRTSFFVGTPDLRWPRGNTATAQTASRGTYISYKGTANHTRAERGTWRWSRYLFDRYRTYWATFIGPYPEILKAEMDYLKAEGLIRSGNTAGALAIINATRATAGLPAATASGVSGSACVPRLPDGTCGSLLEVMKYEKRMETTSIAPSGFFNDARGWGDLPVNTALDRPVPARELETLGKPVYRNGGSGGRRAAAAGTYNY